MKKVFFLSLTLCLTFWSCQDDNVSNDNKSNVVEQSLNNKDSRICLDKFPPSLTGQEKKGSVLQLYKWSVGQTVRVKFLNGDGFLQQKVRQFASEWMSHANINFVFVPSNENSEIKINFDNSNTSWSYYGNSAQNIPQNQASMNFGWFNGSTPDAEFSRTIIHEFGHALGMVHEHQNPNVTIPWNRPAVYAYFAGAPNYWSAQQVDNNILNTFSPSETNSGSYDRASIMHYFFPNGLTLDGSTFTQNNVLSPEDKSFIGQIYPFSNTAGTANLYRYFYNGKHFYTADYNELGANSLEGIVGKVFTTQQPGTEPIYRYNTTIYGGHFYVLGTPVNLSWLQYEGILGYAYRTQQPGTIPVYRYFSQTYIDHFYTNSFSELGNGGYTYAYEGVEFYVLQ